MITLAQVLSLLTTHGFFIIFPLIIIEGPIVTFLAGFLVAQGILNLYGAYVIAVIGDLIGDIFYYYLGRSGRTFGYRLLGKKKSLIKDIEAHFRENSGKTIILGKFAHGVGAVFLFAAGTARMPFSRFLYFNTLATMPKALILLLSGYFFGHSYVRIAHYFDLFGLVTLSLGLLILISYLIFAKRLRRKEGLKKP
jgi:membrane protein DedA with SNARE-associated domain